jgi:arabinofuranosyltransferase
VRHGWVPAVLIAVFAALVLRAAWLCDDAYITFRTVDNLARGLGATWNPGERVQVFTHPLWMLLLSAGRLVTGELYFTSLALSVLLSVLAVFLLATRVASYGTGAALALILLSTSKAFVDYSTSGLEGPLAHLCIVLVALAWFTGGTGPRSAFLLALPAGCLLATRPDGLPLILPMLALGLWERRAHWRAALVGFLPLLTWEMFALLYYGFPFPNTAYAKLSHGLPRGELLVQGLAYLGNSLRLDPITLVTTAGGVAVAVVRRERAFVALGVGVLLQLAYVVWIGGDFMSGRFLTGPLLLAVVVLARLEWSGKSTLVAAVAAVALALLLPHSPLRAPTHYGDDVDSPWDHIDERGITDERAYWFHYTGLFSRKRTDPNERHVTRGYPVSKELLEPGRHVSISHNMGYAPFFAGPEVHWIDDAGLADPLLARLPIYADGALLAPELNAFRQLPWRIAHFRRALPDGYQATIESGRNQLTSPGLAELYDALALVTRGDLWSSERLVTILRLNLTGGPGRPPRP